MNDTVEALERLSKLNREGTLSDAEFAAAKQRILDGQPNAVPSPPPKQSGFKRVLVTILIVGAVILAALLQIAPFIDSVDLSARIIPAGDGRTLVLVTSKNSEPLRIDRVVFNGRTGTPGCDFRTEMDQKNRELYDNTFLKGDPFPTGRTISMGEGFNIQVFTCGAIEKMEVMTDKGSSTLTF